MRYHVLLTDSDSVDLEQLGLPSWVAKVRCLWDRKCGVTHVHAMSSDNWGEPDGEWTDILNPGEDDEPGLEEAAVQFRGRIDENGRFPFEHRYFEQDCLPEFAGGQSKYMAMIRLQNKLHEEMHVLNEQIADMAQRMVDHDFDGDFDPNDGRRKRHSELRLQTDAISEMFGTLVDDRSLYDRTVADEEFANMVEDAAEASADRKTRWEEDGRPVDSDYYGGGGDD